MDVWERDVRDKKLEAGEAFEDGDDVRELVGSIMSSGVGWRCACGGNRRGAD